MAMNRATKDLMQEAEEFKNEIELLSRIYHKNIVGLDYRYDKGEKMFVYNFMANDIVHEWLSNKSCHIHLFPHGCILNLEILRVVKLCSTHLCSDAQRERSLIH